MTPLAPLTVGPGEQGRAARSFSAARPLLLIVILGCDTPAATTASSGAIAPDSTVDSIALGAERALREGRPWLATRILEPSLRDSARRTQKHVLLAARAAAAWGGWDHVERMLAPEQWLDTGVAGEGRELLARAALARRADTVAIMHATLAARAAVDDRQRAQRSVLLARAHERSESWQMAAVAYENAAAHLPELADWLRLRAAALSPDSASRQALYRTVRIRPATRRVPWVEAQARERAQDFVGAATAYDILGARHSALRLRLEAARAVRDTTAVVGIRRELFQLIEARSGSPQARQTAEVIDQRFDPVTPAEELIIARSAAVSGPTSRAITGFARAFGSDLGTSADRFTYATLLSRVRRDGEAAVQFARVRGPASLAALAAYQRARSLLRAGNVDASRAALRGVLVRHARDTAAASLALLLLGDLATDEGNDIEARRHFRSLATRYPGSALASRARLRAAIIAFTARRWRTAALELDSLSLPLGGEDASAARYWAGRAWAAGGDSGTALARWREVGQGDSLSYYGVLAARRRGVDLWSPPERPGAATTDTVIETALERAALLQRVGLDAEAGYEYDQLMADANASVDRLLVTADAFRARGNSSRAMELARRALTRGAPRDARLYRILYPLAHESVIAAETQRHALDRWLVAALIRQESGFDPRATSIAGARGLMQIMPGVGSDLADALDFPLWRPELLYQPDVNVELGTVHLAHVLRKYGEVAYALAAYNAGASRVDRWKRKDGAEDPEVFVERIPFTETRDYVRVVMRNRELYRGLYRRPAGGTEP